MNLPGGWELLLIVAVIVLLFGAKRLPEASRSLGRSLRIFKAETKGLREDDDAPHNYDPRPHDAQQYDRMIHPPQSGQAPNGQQPPQYSQQPQYTGQPQAQPLPSGPPVPGVPPAPGSVPPEQQPRP